MIVGICINEAWNVFNFRKCIIEALQSEGYSVVVIAPYDSYVDSLKKIGCGYAKVNMSAKGVNPIKDLLLIKSLRYIYQQEKLDVILQYTIKPNIYGTLAAKSLSIPVINNVSGLGTVFIRDNIISLIAQKLYKYAFKYPNKIFFQNNDDLREFTNKGLVDSSKCSVLPGSGINVEYFQLSQKKRGDSFVFLMISRMLYDKGIIEYVEAARMLKMKGLAVEFQLLGKIDDSGKLCVPRAKLLDWEEEGVINYLGVSDDVRIQIEEADAVVLPSYREGVPRSLLESAAMGKPLIATFVPGCKEVIIEGYNGYFCKAKDSVSLAKACEKLYFLSETNLMKKGLNSRIFVTEKFDEKIVVDAYLETIRVI